MHVCMLQSAGCCSSDVQSVPGPILQHYTNMTEADLMPAMQRIAKLLTRAEQSKYQVKQITKYKWDIHCAKHPSIHQVTIVLATSKNVLFQGPNHLLITNTDDPTFRLSSPSLALWR